LILLTFPVSLDINFLKVQSKFEEAKFTVESPTDNLCNFTGNFINYNQSSMYYPLDMANLLPRGTTLVNTEFVICLIAYTGEETKIRMNASRFIQSKRPVLESITNTIIGLMLACILSLASVCTIISSFWYNNQMGLNWYLPSYPVSGAEIFFSFLILYNAMIPLSLYLTLEFVKLVQSKLMEEDITMYDEITDTV
jgi:phospholipid-translocating ATPase